MRRESKPVATSSAGFTLIELVVVIVITAIIGGISSTFIHHSVMAYVNSEAYYELADRADVALRRMSRDIRNALPNSVYVSDDGGYVEFVPIKAGGRYKQDDFGQPANTLSVLSESVTVTAGDQLAIYNLGIEGADAYNGDTIRPLTSTGSNLTQLQFSGAAFSLPSPASRFYVVNGAVAYVCDLANRRLLMVSNIGISSAHLASFNAANANVVADDVTGCNFTYTQGVMQHSGVLTAQLELSKSGGVARLLNLINVVNSP
ncbi:MSHA biogenesis protein MshO [Methylophilus rhizosphaerae]|uniref:MSHA biogenesis protein MshO n=1 Tax=Methylophilus rhizosphaerae TaxID=492660 RepID=A0A1G9F290_9PROT|nr:prepilin-type N-terminal cleavage/methylation domain-containing protein [Methylophilus rhizosphaerae]SDK82514.1 MSHA biogenesis protein MshO [Methylophilus rhizosphaerae]